MATALTKHLIGSALREAHEAQRLKEIEPPLPPLKENGGYNIFVFFNIESVEGLGHALMGYGPVGKPIETFSFYRNSKKVIAPAQIACLYEPRTFQSIQDGSGWITHGNNGRFWNEHMTCCLAIECNKQAHDGFKAYVERTKAHPGTYRLLTRNCVHIVIQALKAGGISLITMDGKTLDPVIPRKVFDNVAKVNGASKFGMWAYWFQPCPAPENGFHTRKLLVPNY